MAPAAAAAIPEEVMHLLSNMGKTGTQIQAQARYKQNQNDQPSNLFNVLNTAFPDGYNYTGGFELKAKNPAELPLPIEVILVTGSYSDCAKDVCEQFSTDFGYFKLDVVDYLHVLNRMEFGLLNPMLGSLSPAALARMLKNGEKIPAVFLQPLLRYRLAALMEADGITKVLLSRFDANAEELRRFVEKVAPVTAVLQFEEAQRKDSMVAVDDMDVDKPDARVECMAREGRAVVMLQGESPEALYEKLLGSIAQRALPERKVLRRKSRDGVPQA